MKEKIKGYLKKLINILKMPEMSILPANIAFHIILAIIPLFTIVVLVASSFNISIDLISNLISEVMPRQVADIIIEVISGKGFDGSVGFFNITAFIIASNGTYAVIATSNTLYKIKKSDPIKNRVSSIMLLIIIIILFIFLLVVPVFGENIITLMTSAKMLSNYSKEIMTMFNIIKWPISLIIIYLNIKLIYTMAPSKNVKSEETTYGAAFTTIGWILATIIFRFYINRFARYDIIYGNLASLIILMVWMNLLSYIFVLGMAINASRKEEKELIEEQARLEAERLEMERLKKEAKLKKKAKKKTSKKKKLDEVQVEEETKSKDK